MAGGCHNHAENGKISFTYKYRVSKHEFIFHFCNNIYFHETAMMFNSGLDFRREKFVHEKKNELA